MLSVATGKSTKRKILDIKKMLPAVIYGLVIGSAAAILSGDFVECTSSIYSWTNWFGIARKSYWGIEIVPFSFLKWQ